MRYLGWIALFWSAAAFADTGVLKWAADPESGAPYSFYDPQNPEVMKGYELEIVRALAAEMGLRPEFVQNSWDGLILGLQRGAYDIAINGIEITEDRKKEVLFTSPYYVTGERLTVLKENLDITKLEDVRGKAVGTLKYSVAQRMLDSMGGVDVRSYDSELNAYEDLLNHRTQAVFIDDPIALYYADTNPAFKSTGNLVGRLEYGIAVNKTRPEFYRSFQAALEKIRDNGKLRTILERWKMWNRATAEEFGQDSVARSAPVEFESYVQTKDQSSGWKRKLGLYWMTLPILLKGAWMTLQISVLSMLLATVLGLGLALVRLYGPGWSAALVTLYVEIMRGTPLLIQLFIIFYGLPKIGLEFSAFTAAVIGLGMNYAANESENYRAGFQAIPRAQTEAAHSLGLSRWQTIRLILFPQAMRIVLPPITNDFIALIKDSSLVSVITMTELTKAYGQMASTHYDYLGIGIIVAVIYLLLGLPWVRLSQWLEKKNYAKS